MGTASFLFCVALVSQSAPPTVSPFDAAPPARQPAAVAPADTAPPAAVLPSTEAPPASSAAPATAPRGDRYDRYRSAPPVVDGETSAPPSTAPRATAPAGNLAPPPVMPADSRPPATTAPATNPSAPTTRTWNAPARDPRPSAVAPATPSAAPPASRAVTSPAAAPPASALPATTPAAPPANAALAPANEAATLLAETLTPPAEGALAGQPLSLVNVLTLLSDRGQQLRATQAYWKLSSAISDYHHRLGEYRLLDDISASEVLAQGSESDNLAIHAALARAKADAHAAELAAIAAQHELASLVPLDTRAGLPLATDPPHVGTYRTQFETIFRQGPAPAQAYLTDRLLPIQLEEIRQRAVAIQASNDALDAAVDAWSQSAASPRSVIDSLAALRDQREAFLSAVERYNQEIANYALGIAPLGTGSRELTSMLIKLEDVAARERLVPQVDAAFTTPGQFLPPGQGIAPAGFDQPVRNEPTLADPSREGLSAAPPAESGDPTPAEPGLFPLSDDPADQPRPLRPETAAPQPATPAGVVEGPQFDLEVPPAGELPPAGAMPAGEERAPAEPAAEPKGATKPAREHSAANAAIAPLDAIAALTPVEHTTYYAPDPPAQSNSPSTNYHALLAATPAKRAQRLASLLHWDRAPELQAVSAGHAPALMTLPELLNSVAPGSRLPAIDAYWEAREKLARTQVILEQIGQLDVLAPSVLERRNDPTGPLDMLRLRAAKEASAAELQRALGELLIAEYQLTTLSGYAANESWIRPTTVPHAGGYKLKLESQPARIAGTPAIQRLAETVPGQHTVFTDRAAAVVMADEARATAIHDYQLGAGSIDDVLATIAEETSETDAFLSALTDYNQSIAEYVTTVLSSETPPAKLAGALVLTGSGRSPQDAIERSARGA